MSVRFVYFDLGNVLIRFSVHRMLTQVAELLGQTPEFVHSQMFDEQRYRNFEVGAVSIDEFVDQLCESLETKPNRDDFLNALNDIFWANDPMLPIARKLAKLNFPRGILSNTNQLHWEYVENAFPRIWDAFPDHKISSFAVHALKPFPEIYKIAYEEAKREIPDLQPNEILFIDDLEANVEAAKQFGFQTIHYTEFDAFLAEYKTFDLPVPSRYLEERS